MLSDYLREYGVDVSSPGPRAAAAQAGALPRALGRRVKLKTDARKLRGEVARADDDRVTVAAEGEEFDIPYEQIVRGNLIDERRQ